MDKSDKNIKENTTNNSAQRHPLPEHSGITVGLTCVNRPFNADGTRNFFIHRGSGTPVEPAGLDKAPPSERRKVNIPSKYLPNNKKT